MKKFIVLLSLVLFSAALHAQDKIIHTKTTPGMIEAGALPDIQTCMQKARHNLSLFTANPVPVHDVNSIIKETEVYIDSMPRTKSKSDELLIKHFEAMRHFFLTTTNKTSVAAEFIYADAPYSFCTYNDTALALYLCAVRDCDPYNLSKTTDKRIARNALTDCLLPSIAALDSFGSSDIKYIGLSVYYGCKDPREGAPDVGVMPYCLTLVTRLTYIEQYAAGLLTEKGLLLNAEVYLADSDGMRRLNME